MPQQPASEFDVAVHVDCPVAAERRREQDVEPLVIRAEQFVERLHAQDEVPQACENANSAGDPARSSSDTARGK